MSLVLLYLNRLLNDKRYLPRIGVLVNKLKRTILGYLVGELKRPSAKVLT